MNINYTRDYNWIGKLNPVTFNYKQIINKKRINKANDKLEYGLIAEEVSALNKDMCLYDKNGKLLGVDYKKLIVPTIAYCQDLESRLSSMENMLKKMNELVKAYSTRIAIVESK